MVSHSPWAWCGSLLSSSVFDAAREPREKRAAAEIEVTIQTRRRCQPPLEIVNNDEAQDLIWSSAAVTAAAKVSIRKRLTVGVILQTTPGAIRPGRNDRSAPLPCNSLKLPKP
jgi:hypothetical protein